MDNNGKQLEALVAFVEKTLLPEGFDVTTNARVFSEDGVQVAEFDIEAKGRVGSTDIAWLIECRDRPTSGPAPGSWIEQLAGRRDRFGFNKVTAVSTTGFATGAVQYAQSAGIELREVNALAPEEFSDWLLIREMRRIERVTKLERMTIFVSESLNGGGRRAVQDVLASVDGNTQFLAASQSGEKTTPANAFSGIAAQVEEVFAGLEPNGPGRKVELEASFPNDDHYVIDTEIGPVRVQSIRFVGEAFVKETILPLMNTSEYRRTDSGELISQVAAFAAQSIDGMKFTMELHRMADSGETHVIARRVDDDG